MSTIAISPAVKHAELEGQVYGVCIGDEVCLILECDGERVHVTDPGLVKDYLGFMSQTKTDACGRLGRMDAVIQLVQVGEWVDGRVENKGEPEIEAVTLKGVIRTINPRGVGTTAFATHNFGCSYRSEGLKNELLDVFATAADEALMGIEW